MNRGEREPFKVYFALAIIAFLGPVYFVIFTDIFSYIGNEISAKLGPHLRETLPYFDCFQLETSPTSFMIKCNFKASEQSPFYNARILEYVNIFQSTLNIDYIKYNCKCFYEPFELDPFSEKCRRKLSYHSEHLDILKLAFIMLIAVALSIIYRKIWYGEGIAEQLGIPKDCLLSISVFDFGAFVCRREAEIK